MKKYSYLFLFFISLLTFSCTKSLDDDKDKEAELSNIAVVKSFGFTLGNNPDIAKTSYAFFAGNTLYISVANGELNRLTASITASEKAKIYINGAECSDGLYSGDFSGIVPVKIVSESGKVTNQYEVYAKKGDPSFDEKIYSFMYDYSIPGVSVSVMRGEDSVYSSGYGYAVLEGKVKTTPNSLFRLGSVSKQFTTLCIMKLLESGKLSIDDAVFGEGNILNKQFPGVTGSKATITLRNFLQHNSGFPTSPDPMFTSSIRDGKSIDDLINYILDLELSNIPGAKYSYYNMGFGILGRVVEVLSGEDYEKFLKEEVLKPMGITDIHVGGGQDERRSNECVYYSQEGTNGYGNPMRVIEAAGGIIASTDQLMEVLRHIDGRSGVPDTYKSSTLDLMYNSPSTNYSGYSLGWRINHSLYPGAHYHAGNLAGTTAMWVGDCNGMSAALLCNSRSYISGYDDAYYYLMSDILEYFRK